MHSHVCDVTAIPVTRARQCFVLNGPAGRAGRDMSQDTERKAQETRKFKYTRVVFVRLSEHVLSIMEIDMYHRDHDKPSLLSVYDLQCVWHCKVIKSARRCWASRS